MKNRFLLLITSLFLLSGCSSSESNEISVNNPYEIVKGTHTLSYYDTEDNIDIEGFNVVISNIESFRNDSNNIYFDDGVIRCITIVDPSVKTYRSISVGDKIDKIEDTFEYERKTGDFYTVVFDNDSKEVPTNQIWENDWICITYFTDDSQITSIMILDALFATKAI